MRHYLLLALVVLILFSTGVSFASTEIPEDDSFSAIFSDLADDLKPSYEEAVKEVKPRASVYLGGWSHHLGEGDYNENNQLIAVNYENWVVGTFVNSYNDRSYMAGYNFELDAEDWRLGVLTGVSSGYQADDMNENYAVFVKNGIMPVVFPYVAYTGYNVHPTLGFFGPALMLTFEYQF